MDDKHKESFIFLLILSILFCFVFTSSCSTNLTNANAPSQSYITPGSTPYSSQPTGPRQHAPDSFFNSAISWQDAYLYKGNTITIYGPVVDSHWAETSKGKPTFLNIGKPYPDSDRFTILIWINERNIFPAPPETYYLGKTIYVTGIIEEYNGSYEMVVRSPSQIVIR